ncbi:MAG: hypothetical protein KDB23_20410, partial [Planctomycetales bacterium]|nr:hypothetical protein [Planctomycetales bacterium]
YQGDHLPAGLCYCYRDNANATIFSPRPTCGIIKQGMLIDEDQTQSLNFGGTTMVTGRLYVNDAPLAEGHVMLCDDFQSGYFQAITTTDSLGNFAFRGVNPSELTLYYRNHENRNWVRASRRRIDGSDQNLGEIHAASAKLTVNVEPNTELSADSTLRLVAFDRHLWFANGGDIGRARPRRYFTDPVVIDAVPDGEYELAYSAPNQVSWRQRVVVESASREIQLKFTVPKGTASIRGTVSPELRQQAGSLVLHRRDGRGVSDLADSFKIDGLPAGEYEISSIVRDFPPMLAFTLKEGEQKSIELNESSIANTTNSEAHGFVWTYDEDGLPLTGCGVTFDDTSDAPLNIKINSHLLYLVGRPGAYDATISYPGFKARRVRANLMRPEKGEMPSLSIQTIRLARE